MDAIKHIKQKYLSDCGVACVAMIANVSWTEAFNKFFELNIFDKKRNKKDFYTTSKDLSKVLTSFGYNFSDRLHHTSNIDSFFLDYPSIYKQLVNKRYFHWIVLDSNLNIYDPDRPDVIGFKNMIDNDLQYIANISSRLIKRN